MGGLAPPTTNRTILVVDDDQHCRGMLVTALEFTGFVVHTASDGYDALKRIEQQPPSLIVLDLNMPRVDGWEVCRELASRDATRHIPVVVVSAEAGVSLERLGVAVSALLLKPCDPAALIEILRRLIDQSHSLPAGH